MQTRSRIKTPVFRPENSERPWQELGSPSVKSGSDRDDTDSTRTGPSVGPDSYSLLWEITPSGEFDIERLRNLCCALEHAQIQYSVVHAPATLRSETLLDQRAGRLSLLSYVIRLIPKLGRPKMARIRVCVPGRSHDAARAILVSHLFDEPPRRNSRRQET